MVGIVLVSHSRALALSVQELVRSMSGPALPLAIAAGTGDNHAELGTDAVEIIKAIKAVHNPDGVLVLMDMGSAILSSETALDLLEEPLRAHIRFCAAPFVEGAVAAGVTANLGAPLEEVCAEALAALKQKETALNSNPPITGTKSSSPQSANGTSITQPGEKIRLTVRNAHGLHARPAARLIAETRPFHSEITVRNLSNQRGPVSIKSLSSLATLEILQGNEIEIQACGDDAAAALEKIGRLIESGLGDTLSSEANGASSGGKVRSASASVKSLSTPVPISSGIAIGPGIYFKDSGIEIPQDKARDINAEIDRLRDAVTSVEKALKNRRDQMGSTVGAANAGIYEAQMIALQDPELIGNAIRVIKDDKINAAVAWDQINRQIVSRYESLQDPYLRERAADLEDVGRQVLELLAAKKTATPALTQPAILIADSLNPYQVSTLDRKLVLGVILFDGGPTAHSSILLKAVGIPAIVQARSVFGGIDLNQPLVVALDGTAGTIWLNPDADLLAKLKNRQAEERRNEEKERAASSLPAATREGHRIEIFANIGNLSEVEGALNSGAEGVGLLRTEFLFLERNSAPTEEEQRQALLAVADKMKGKPLVVRTLDAGGDKELSYLDTAREENPFLGVRAIRLCFSHEELFATQLRAILRAGHGHDFRIMFPMIANVTDFNRAMEFLEKAHRDLEKQTEPHLWPIKTGIMIEIPSAALQAEALARRCEFFSIGTNDLTQYTLAADRGNPSLASYQDALHPSVLRLIKMVVEGAEKHNRLVAVCGEAASDPIAAGIFVGLGVRELSLSGGKIPQIKTALRRRTLNELQKQARKALHCESAADVRALATEDVVSNH